MRRIFAVPLLMFVLLVSGCNSIPQQAFQQPADNALVSDAFVALMEQGKTTRKQEQAFILANRRAWHAQNFALNETPLPADIDPATRNGVNLLEILQSDLRVRAKLKEVEDALQPEQPTQPDGN